ncbi:MAG: hypothetical protein UW38_C0001G0475 [Candidatus Saccharibacteria bacterium GW2011_GWC2_44_17]|nr:MAG: hypothetical protein UW38_C0001G0475 [Candidatus Saccharibacteria bacterium GW2011_GWC2_44_17]MBH1955984.1 prepilin-type N-terminal cleavage/methylation domain-containing protein [Candidatus Saccharibacteria bacterium]OGL23711.1 MAG: hypothetical protein A2791_02650 [Candidatus Saccharibacteria bacterium RIFCSPHIGHO2_01_FULL_46_30]OGL33887.1 MAG: hypothetical protein A3E20_04050 [Candidatus Saccharibacteria bacterium RIFCSPHIGHO2_12_FULL_47_16]MBH1972372.1 prepilin-type N-terminal cleav
MKNTHPSSGFTVVEVLVTLVIISLFMGLFFQTYMAMESQRLAVQKTVFASNIAYANLRKFSERPDSTKLSCTNDMNLASNPTAPGIEIGGNNTSPNTFGFVGENLTTSLGTDATQQVLIFAPNGCTRFADMPLKIVSIVRYGPASNQEEIAHVSYVK